MSKEARAFQRLMGDLFLAISSPDATAFAAYAAAIIDSEKRDEIIDYEQSSKKKRALLTAVECRIKLSPNVYYEFLEILSRDMAMDSICQKMREECGADPSQLTTCIPSIKAPPPQAHDRSLNTAGTSGHDPLSSTSSVPLTPMEVYVRFLKTIYRFERMPTYLKPDVSHGAKTFINLALVHREAETQSKRMESIMCQFRGNIDEIRRRKTPLELKDIGWVNVYDYEEKKVVRRFTQNILIEGAPGVGKTTLSWHLCRMWEKGELFHQWSVVVMLQLRDKRLRQAKTLNDLFYHPKPEVRQAVVKESEENEGSGVLLIFEGYDELSQSQLLEDCILTQLLERRFLPAAAIMVTSRPLATGRLPYKFKRNVDLQHIEVVGFREEDIIEYITAACQDKRDILKGFRSYLSCHPFVYSAMYNPLHCAIVSNFT